LCRNHSNLQKKVEKVRNLKLAGLGRLFGAFEKKQGLAYIKVLQFKESVMIQEQEDLFKKRIVNRLIDNYQELVSIGFEKLIDQSEAKKHQTNLEKKKNSTVRDHALGKIADNCVRKIARAFRELTLNKKIEEGLEARRNHKIFDQKRSLRKFVDAQLAKSAKCLEKIRKNALEAKLDRAGQQIEKNSYEIQQLLIHQDSQFSEVQKVTNYESQIATLTFEHLESRDYSKQLNDVFQAQLKKLERENHSLLTSMTQITKDYESILAHAKNSNCQAQKFTIQNLKNDYEQRITESSLLRDKMISELKESYQLQTENSQSEFEEKFR
jgi:predicted nuclease of predicted toxin-antitoxin system